MIWSKFKWVEHSQSVKNLNSFNPVQMIRSKGEYGEVSASVDAYERLNSFCYKGLQPSLPHFWSSASLKLDLDGTDYQVNCQVMIQFIIYHKLL